MWRSAVAGMAVLPVVYGRPPHLRPEAATGRYVHADPPDIAIPSQRTREALRKPDAGGPSFRRARLILCVSCESPAVSAGLSHGRWLRPAPAVVDGRGVLRQADFLSILSRDCSARAAPIA